MRRLVASASFALVLIAGTAFALDGGGPDASLLDGGIVDGGILDGSILDVVVSDGSSDAPEADASDATAADATADASDASTIKDAKSDVCDPNVEPCTVRADTGPDTDAGDSEEPGQNGGCSCDTAASSIFGVASTTPIVFLLAAFALMTRRRRR